MEGFGNLNKGKVVRSVRARCFGGKANLDSYTVCSKASIFSFFLGHIIAEGKDMRGSFFGQKDWRKHFFLFGYGCSRNIMQRSSQITHFFREIDRG